MFSALLYFIQLNYISRREAVLQSSQHEKLMLFVMLSLWNHHTTFQGSHCPFFFLSLLAHSPHPLGAADKVSLPKANANFIACVASVSVRFRSKERPRNWIFGFDRARNKTKAKKWKRGSSFTWGICRAVFDYRSSFLLLNRTETLATQATNFKEFKLLQHRRKICWKSSDS